MDNDNKDINNLKSNENVKNTSKHGNYLNTKNNVVNDDKNKNNNNERKTEKKNYRTTKENKKGNKTENGNSKSKQNKDCIDLDKKKKILRIYSYNSRGFDKIKQQVCNELLTLENVSIPILCNQENFVLKGNTHTIKKALPEYHVFVKPAKKDKLEGRPVNGGCSQHYLKICGQKLRISLLITKGFKE